MGYDFQGEKTSVVFAGRVSGVEARIDSGEGVAGDAYYRSFTSSVNNGDDLAYRWCTFRTLKFPDHVFSVRTERFRDLWSFS